MKAKRRFALAAPRRPEPNRIMAELNHTHDVEADPEPDYTTGEMILWMVGILMIPLVPIMMVWFLTPWSGMQ